MIDTQILEKIDALYSRYGYEIKKNHKGARVYLYTRSIYNGAEIVQTSQDCDINRLKTEYTNQDYAVRIQKYSSEKEAEDVLFREFFKADSIITSLNRRYQDFVSRLMLKLPIEANYQYIQSPYEYTSFSNDGYTNGTISYYKENDDFGLIKRISHLIDEHKGPLFIIIEAAAGYGKTCTAYEVLDKFIKLSNSKIPFFTELSRDRRATIFSHILRKEIEEQFANRVDSHVVIHEIKQGRIPLIIDGFDELISKDFSFSTSEFAQVESMLSTIVELLTENAKIIITSRKTALFNSEEFFNWMSERAIEYSMVKITISEPQTSDWLNREQLEIINNGNLPLNQFSNPVLLSYLKYLSIIDLHRMIIEEKSIIDSYIDFLLKREQDRQSLLMEPEVQMRIFRKIIRLFSEFDIKAATKEDLKELILEYNKPILEDTIKKYTPDSRPRIDQLADTLTNHAFLDRKDRFNIGFINEFIFGVLIGQNLVQELFAKHKPQFFKTLSPAFSNSAIQAFKAQPDSQKKALWEIFEKYQFPYDDLFYLTIDICFQADLLHNYNQISITNFEFDSYYFVQKEQFHECIFSECVFRDCVFQLTTFSYCSFINCKFYDCGLGVSEATNSSDHITIYSGEDNNGFINQVFDYQISSDLSEINFESILLEKFFKKGSYQAQYRQISNLRKELQELDQKELTKMIHSLKSKGFIVFNGDLCHITKEGMQYYNEHFRNS